jgi:hypothetical protein
MRCPGKANWLVLVCAVVLLGAGCAQPPSRGAGEPSPDAAAGDAGPVSKVVYPVKDILDRLPPWEALVASSVRNCSPTPLKRMDVRQWMLMYTIATSLPEGACAYEREDESFVDERGNITIEGDRLVVTHTAHVQALVADLLWRTREAFAAMDGKPGAVVGFTEDSATAALRRRLAQERVDVDFRDVLVVDALQSFSKQCGLKITLAPVRQGLFEDTSEDLAKLKVTLRMRQASPAAVLDAMLGPHAYYDVQGGGIIVVSRISEMPMQPDVAAVYPMADAVESVLRFYVRPGLPLKDVHPSYLERAGETTSSVVGGRYLAGLMFITTQQTIHEIVAQNLSQLRRALATRDAMPPRGGPPAPEQPVFYLDDPETIATYRLLKETVELHVKEKPLPEALDALSAARPGLNFVGKYDELSGFKVSVDERASVERILSLLFDENCWYMVGRGYIMVGQGRLMGSEEPCRGLYPIADLLPRWASNDEVDSVPTPVGIWIRSDYPDDAQDGVLRIVKEIKRTVNQRDDRAVADWEWKNSGAGFAHLGGILIVDQTRRGHEKVAEFLTQLRREQQAPQK